jgi:4-hydroxybenzoate polyprenyltransferase
MAWLRLIRWPNLIIIALTQFAAWWCVIWPFQKPEVLTPLNFLLICLSTILIAAGGYIINDYFDIRIDVINKPDKVILERDIPRRLAIIVHSVLTVVALLLAAFVALPAGHPEWLLVQVLCSIMLWRYSTTWKRQFVIGNLIVAVMTALTVLVLIVYEPSIFKLRSAPALMYKGKFFWIINPVYVLFGFAFFAFTLTWMREIVKDMEDFKGDEAEGCITMPIKWGLLRSSRFVQMLAVITLLVLAYSSYRIWSLDFHDLDLVLYINLVMIPALSVWAFRLPAKATMQHYHQSSRQLKLIMVLGVIALLVYHF